MRRFDRGTLKKPRRLDNGFLQLEGYLTRAGVFEYRNPNGTIRREYRPPEEVSHADSLATLEMATLTNGHPADGFVTADNRKELSVGTIGGIAWEQPLIRGRVQVEDAQVIADVEAGKVELSCGYDCDMVNTPGTTPTGERYDCVQRNIKYNHVALVERGRAGPDVRVRMDSADAVMLPSAEGSQSQESESNVEFEINGVKVKVAGEADAAVIRGALNAATAKADAAEKAAAEAKSNVEKQTARADGAEEALKAEKAKRTDAEDPKKVREAVKARVALETTARAHLDEKTDLSELDEKAIKLAVLKKLAPSFKVDGKGDEYINARFDFALENAGSDTLANVRVGSNPDLHTDSDDFDADKAAKEFVAKQAAAFKPKAK